MSNKLLSSFSWSALEQGTVKLVQLIVQIALARILAPEAFGVLAILLVLINIADIIAQSGLGTALIQDQKATSESYSTAFWLSLIVALVLYAVLFVCAPFIASFYAMDNLDMYMRVLAIVLFLNSASSIFRSNLQKDLHFKTLFKCSMSASLLSGVVGIGAALVGLNIWALVLQVLTQSLISFAYLLIKTPNRPHICFRVNEARKLFSYGWKICLTGVLNVSYTSVSELIIGKVSSHADLGYYSQGRKWPIAVIAAGSNAISNVLFPAFSKIKDNRDELVAAIKKTITVGTYVLAPFSFLMIAIAEPLVVVLMTEKWLPCVPVFQMVCIPYCVLMLELASFRAYMALGDSGLYLKLHVIKISVGIVLITATALLSRNIYVIAFVTALFELFTIIVIELQPAQRMFGFGRLQQLKCAFPAILIGIVAMIASLGVSFVIVSYLLKLIVGIVVYIAVFTGLSAVFKPIGFLEIISLAKSVSHRQ